MVVNDVDVSRSKNGFYNAMAIYKASPGDPGKRPEAFLTYVSDFGQSFSNHVERVHGSNPGLFFSKWISVMYSSWISEEFFNIFCEVIEKEEYREIFIEGVNSLTGDEVRDNIYAEGVKKGRDLERQTLRKYLSDRPAHPVQNKNINIVDLWKASKIGGEVPPSEFFNYVSLASQSFRDFGREDVVSSFDWDEYCYWVTPEFAFHVSSYFSFGSSGKNLYLSSLKEKTKGEIWANNL